MSKHEHDDDQQQQQHQHQKQQESMNENATVEIEQQSKRPKLNDKGNIDNITTSNNYPMCNGTFNTSNLIKEGDLVIIHIVRDTDLRHIYIKKGERFNCVFGSFPHELFIGKPFGSKIFGSINGTTSSSPPFIHALRPSPQLWTLSLSHRTQILYNADISLVLSMLYLKPGSKVVESGTGSGSLSHAIARCIAPNGHLYTFEYHEQRFKEATMEFKRNGFSDLVTIRHCDAYQDGFTMNNTIEPNSIDAVFLDLPKPWKCIDPHVNHVLKSCGGRFCAFSPCIEQVQRTADRLRQFHYVDIKVYECLQKGYTNTLVTHLPEVSWNHSFDKNKADSQQKKENKLDRMFLPEREMRAHTGYLLFATRFPSA
jgi:tRNA (adenine57-N1/adenine58-N1)-methyltransferase